MKKLNILIVLALLILVFFNSCKKEEDDDTENKTSILPANWGVDIPNSISYVKTIKSASATQDTLNGNDIYEHLRTFVAVGEGASDIVSAIIQAITVHNINQAMSLSYTSDEDGRVKHLEVIENSSFDGENWEFQLTISDASSRSENDGGNGLQVFWNKTPIKGISILKPYNINRTDNSNEPNAMFKIAYSEAGNNGYSKEMTVEIIDLAINITDKYYMRALKMFAGKNGNTIDIYGNSDHPNATFFNDTNIGFNWAFTASSNETLDIAVAEVGLPSNDLNSTNRNEILITNSLYNVFNNQIQALGFNQQDIDNYLHNTNAPGYFNNSGFIQGGNAPSSNTTEYGILKGKSDNLTPYNPTNIKDLTISFK